MWMLRFMMRKILLKRKKLAIDSLLTSYGEYERWVEPPTFDIRSGKLTCDIGWSSLSLFPNLKTALPIINHILGVIPQKTY